MTVSRWMLLRRFGFVACTLIGLYLVLVASMGVWAPQVADAIEGTQWYAELMRMVSIRWMLKDILVDRYPQLGAAILYDHRRPIDWHLLGIGLLVVAARGPLTSLLTTAASVVLRPLVLRKFRVQADADRIRIGSGILKKSIDRRGGFYEISFRAVDAAAHHPIFDPGRLSERRMLRPLLDTPPAVLEIMTSTNRRELLFLRRHDQAEAIAGRCNELLARTGGAARVPGT